MKWSRAQAPCVCADIFALFVIFESAIVRCADMPPLWPFDLSLAEPCVTTILPQSSPKLDATIPELGVEHHRHKSIHA